LIVSIVLSLQLICIELANKAIWFSCNIVILTFWCFDKSEKVLATYSPTKNTKKKIFTGYGSEDSAAPAPAPAPGKKPSALSPSAQAPSTLDPVATQLPSTKSLAPHLSPSTILNSALSLFLMVFVMFRSIR
jgi:hypothetical protein